MTDPAPLISRGPAPPTPLAPRLQSSWLLALFLWLVYVVHGIDRTVMYVLLQPISQEFGLSNAEIGFIAGTAYIVPYAIAGIPLGALGDRVRRTRLLALLIAIWSLSTLGTSLATGLATLMLARGIVGGAEGGAPPLMQSLIADGAPPRWRPPLLSVLMTGPFIGLMIGSLLAGAVAQHAGWRAALLVAGVPGLVLALLIALILREPPRGHWDAPAGDIAPISIRGALTELVRHRGRLLIFLAMSLSAVAPLAFAAWMPVYLIRVHHIPIEGAGRQVGLALGLCGGLGTITGGVLAARFVKESSRRLLLFSATFVALAIPAGLTALLAGSTSIAVVSLGLWAFVASMYVGPTYTAFIAAIPVATRSTLLATIAVLANLIGAIGPQFAGWASDRLTALGDPNGLRDAVLLCLIVLPLQALALFRAARHAPA